MVNIKHLNTEKHDQDNFYVWKAHVKALLHGYDLLQYVETSIILKDDLMVWQDQLLLIWIFLELKPEVLSQVVSFRTSAQVWSVLQEIYTSTSGSRILHLCQQIHAVRNGDMSTTDYLSMVTKLADVIQIGAPHIC